MKDWQESLIKAIETKVQQTTDGLDFDKTYKAIVQSIDSDTILVNINGGNYIAKKRKGLTLYVGDMVSVKSINNNFSDLLIENVLKGQGGDNAPPPQEVTSVTYIHTQISSQSVWIITHNLNKYPSVTVVDSAESTVVGDVEYISENQIRIEFSAPFGGRAYLN